MAVYRKALFRDRNQTIKRTLFTLVKFQPRYVNSHRIFHNFLSLKGFGNSAAPEIDYLNRTDNRG